MLLLLSHFLSSFAFSSIFHISNFIVVVLLSYIYTYKYIEWVREREMGMNKNVFIFQWEIFALPFSQQSLNAFVAKIHIFFSSRCLLTPKIFFSLLFFFGFFTNTTAIKFMYFLPFSKAQRSEERGMKNSSIRCQVVKQKGISWWTRKSKRERKKKMKSSWLFKINLSGGDQD